MSFHNPQNSLMEVASPFMICINQCRTKMKKLRKKIYKNLKAKQFSSPSLKKKVSGKDVQGLLRAQKVPEFVSNALRSSPGEDGLKDITNITLTNPPNSNQLRLYADQQERQVESILQAMREQRQMAEHELSISEEEQSTFNRMKSRRWLQSTEMEYEDQDFMERHSKISLRPFELFPPEEQSVSKQSGGGNHLREPNGFLSMQSHNYLEENIFPF